jgi:hypothetical protein
MMQIIVNLLQQKKLHLIKSKTFAFIVIKFILVTAKIQRISDKVSAE